MQETSKRYLTHETITVKAFGRMGNLRAMMKNLSQTGCYLEISKGDYLPKPGDILLLSLPLRTLNKVRVLNAEVVWKKGFGLGVTFISKDDVKFKIKSQNMV